MADPFLCPKFTVETGDEIFFGDAMGEVRRLILN